MSERKPIDPDKLKVGDVVEWVESDGFVWTVEVLDIRSHGLIVDSGYGKTALFAPNSQDASKYTLLVGEMEMRDYLQNPKRGNKAPSDTPQPEKAVEERQSVEPETFQVGDKVEWVESDGCIWDETVLEVNGDEVTVSCSWAKRVFIPHPGGDGKHRLVREGDPETDEYIRHPKIDTPKK